MPAHSYTLQHIADFLSAEMQGDPHITVTHISPLQQAEEGSISFLDNPKYRKYLSVTQASAVILTADMAPKCPCAKIIVANPYVAYAKLATLFETKATYAPGIHPTAVIGEHAVIDLTAYIGPQAVIGRDARIAAHAQIHAGTVVGDHAHVGEHSVLWPRVVVYHGVTIGTRVIIHSGAVIGADGFGFAFHEGKWLKIPQIGSVVIGDDVEIGANTTIDRGALGNTMIEKGVKLDNQIQIGHNVHIGEYTIIAGCTAIAGSVNIGKYCRIGGSVAIAGHLTIADQVVLTGGSGVASSIPASGMYASGVPAVPYQQWRKNTARLQNLDKLARKVNNIAQQVGLSEQREDLTEHE